VEPLPASGVSSLIGTPRPETPELVFDAVVLAGGRASRLGGFPKPTLRFGGATLLEHALGAVDQARAVAVVGPETSAVVVQPPPDGDGRLRWTLESPRFAGPVAALAAGLAALRQDPAGRAPWLALLAADLPRAREALAPLVAAAAAEPRADVVLAEDDGGRAQPLLALYRRAPLERILAELDDDGGLADRPLRHLVARLTVLPLRLPPGLADDVDTWPAAERWGIRRPEGPGSVDPTGGA
jgi:molybdopterin-guanine dinucleotide biosynthesis protein A